MVRGALARILIAASGLEPCTGAYGEPGSPAAIILAQAQTPDAEKQAPQPAPQPAPAPAGTQPAPAAPPGQPPPAPGTAAPGTPSAPVELPPIKIIEAPRRPKPARKPGVRKPAPQRTVEPAGPPARASAAPGAPVAGRPTVSAPSPAAPEVTATEPSGEAAEQTVPMSPIKGSEIPLEKVPSAVSTVTSAEIQRSGSPAIEDALQQNVPGVIISDVNGNPFSTDVQFRGFTSSPVEGTPQGLAVYQNGVRINEVFGDTVNWELIPSTAINSIAVVTGNPLYGLNALGGALNLSMKDGFSFQGVESDTRAGSYGRFQESLQLGKQVDNFAAYVAIEGIWDDGWREFSPSEVRRAYVDLGVKDKDTEFHINFTGGETALGVVGPTPIQLLPANYGAVFTSPQTTDNELAMLSVNGSTKLTDTLSLSGVAYLRSFHQQHADGNVSSVAPCNLLNGGTGYDASTPLCLQTADGAIVPVYDQHGNQITTGKYYGPNDTIGEIDF